MADQTTLSVEERLYRLLRLLGVDQAHFAGWLDQDWSGLVAKYPQVISSLTLVNRFDRRLEPVSAKLLVITSDTGHYHRLGDPRKSGGTSQDSLAE